MKGSWNIYSDDRGVYVLFGKTVDMEMDDQMSCITPESITPNRIGASFRYSFTVRSTSWRSRMTRGILRTLASVNGWAIYVLNALKRFFKNHTTGCGDTSH